MEPVSSSLAEEAVPALPDRDAPGALLRGGLVACLLLGALAGAVALRVRLDPTLPFLRPHPPGEWIRPHAELFLGVRPNLEAAEVRTTVAPHHAPLRLRVWSPGEVRAVFDREVLTPTRAPRLPDEPLLFELPAHGTPSSLTLVVAREIGPAVVVAVSDPPAIATDASWQGRFVRASEWGPVAVADGTRAHPLSMQFPGSWEALRRVGPLLVGVLVAVAFLVARGRRDAGRLATVVRWSTLAAWAALAVNNVTAVPLYLGFDLGGHLTFIQRIARGDGLPLPGDGWQMFQSPLYYLLSGALAVPLERWFSPDTLLRGLRVIPLLAGLLQVELAFRACRLVFPTRGDLQAAGTLVGGLMPMNLYMSQYVGNEPLAAALSAASLVATLAVLRQDRRAASWRWPAMVGLLLGLALLTKVSALVLAPVVLAALAWSGQRAGGRRHLLAAPGVAVGVTVMVAGWYYLRNWLLVGSPFVGGWDPARGIVWWQDPGFRTWEQFLSFGLALERPIFAGTYGLWDALWSTLWLDGYLSSIIITEAAPPWNLSFVCASSLVSVVPATLLVLGGAIALDPRGWRHRPGLLIAAVALFAFLAAIVGLYVQVPIYSTAKATYTLGLLPAYGVLAAAGLGVVTRRRWHAIVFGALSAWAVNGFLGYFVVG